MRNPNRERGTALLVVMVGMTVVLLLLLSGLTMAAFSGRQLKRQLTYQGQALNAARAGLTEGLSWFIRQQPQPVTDFDPILDAEGNCTHTPAHIPPVNDSEDATIGIVRTYEFSSIGRLRGRYEVRRSEVSDITTERGKGTSDDGTIWQLESEGAVYIENSNTDAYDEPPNIVLARRTMRTEIQRLQLRLPAPSAVFVSRGNRMTTNTTTRVRGGSSSGITYPCGTGTPTIGAGSVTGTPAHANWNPNAPSPCPNPVTLMEPQWSIQQVFGMTKQELVQSADMVVPDAASIIAFPVMGLVVVQGNATFTPTNRLDGSGILVIFGDLTIQANTLSRFNGVIYVEGRVDISQPTSISGALLAVPAMATAGNYVTLTGGGDFVEVDYDPAIMNQIRQQLGQYRTTRSPYIPGAQP